MSLYVWGANHQQQLAGQNGNKYAPCLVTASLQANIPVSIACGDFHSLVLCESGDLFSFGRGREGQLGHSDATTFKADAMQVVGLENETIVSIAAGSLTSYAITSTGDVYHW